MKYKMIACDLDGTLLGSGGRLSSENIMAISVLNKMGVHFVPCTGRTLSAVKEFYSNPDIRYVIYSTGAGILDKQGEIVIKNGLPYEAKRKPLSILSSYDVFLYIHADGNCYTDKRLKGRGLEYNLSLPFSTAVDNFAIDEFERNFLKMEVENVYVYFKNETDREKRYMELLSVDGIVVIEPWPNDFEIFNSKASKGEAIKQLAGMLGIDISEVISIGDSANDISALKAAGLGIAVSNGNDRVKDVADVVGCSNDEHVAKYVIERYFM